MICIALLTSLAFSPQDRTPLVEPHAGNTRIGHSQELTVQGTVVMPEGHSIPHDMRVTVYPTAYGETSSTDSWSVTVSSAGGFEVETSESTPILNLVLDSDDYSGQRTLWRSGEVHQTVEIRARAQDRVSVRAKGPDGKPITTATFFWIGQPSEQRTIRSHPLQTQSDGLFRIPSGSRGSGPFRALFGVAEGPLVMGPIVIPPDEQQQKTPVEVTFTHLAKLRFSVTGKYPNPFGPVRAQVASQALPQIVTPDGYFFGIPAIPLAPESLLPQSEPWSLQEGPIEFWVSPGEGKELTITSTDGWKGKRSLLPLLPGGVYDLAPIQMDPGHVVRGRVIDSNGNPMSRVRVRGLCGWNVPEFQEMQLADIFGINPYPSALRRIHRETWTDDEGRFLFRVPERLVAVPLEVSSEVGDSPHRLFQMHPRVPCNGAEQILRWSPGEEGLNGAVLAPDGSPVSRFRVLLRPTEYAAELDYDDFWNRENRPVTWFDMHSDLYRSSSSSLSIPSDCDGQVLGPPYTPYSAFPCDDAQGEFALQGLWPGAYEWKVEADGWPTQEWQSISIPASTPALYRLQPAGGLAIEVTHHDEKPWRSLEFTMEGPLKRHQGTSFVSSEGIEKISTDVWGRVQRTHLTPGEYRLRVASYPAVALDERLVHVRAGEITQVTWKGYGQGNIRGHLTWEGAPDGIQAVLHWDPDQPHPFGNQKRSYPRPTAPVQAGEFAWQNLREGRYQIRFVSKDKSPRIDHILQPIEIEVYADRTTQHHVRPVEQACQVHAVVHLNGLPVRGGYLRLHTPGESIKTRTYPVHEDGSVSLWVAHPGEHEMQYGTQAEGKTPGERQVQGQGHFSIAPGTSKDQVFAFEQGRLELDLSEFGEIDQRLAKDLQLTRIDCPDYLTVKRSLTPGTTTQIFDALPTGTYTLVRKRWRSPAPWTPILSQQFVVSRMATPSQNKVAAQRTFDIQLDLEVTNLPEGTQFWVKAYSSPDADKPIRETYWRPRLGKRHSIQGLDPGPIWITLKATRPHIAFPLSPTLGPFQVMPTASDPIPISLRWDEFR